VPLPAITAVVPARNEAGILPACLPSLLRQEYQGRLAVVLVDDDSSDSTAKVAAAIGAEAGWLVTSPAGPGNAGPGAAPGDRELAIVSARPCPPGWAGKVWAMAEGVRAAGDHTGYLLFTDADIAYRPGTLTALARAGAGSGFTMVSQMALLRVATRWE
jgi:glycosyltransferase involved in cell wall biosynthesis